MIAEENYMNTNKILTLGALLGNAITLASGTETPSYSLGPRRRTVYRQSTTEPARKPRKKRVRVSSKGSHHYARFQKRQRSRVRRGVA